MYNKSITKTVIFLISIFQTLLSLSKLAGLAADDPREEVITEDHIEGK